MPREQKIRSGTVAEHNSFTGSTAEVTMVTDRVALRVHNSSTVGGFEIPVIQYLTKSVAGASNITLTEAETGYSTMEFTGVLTGNVEVYPTTSRLAGKCFIIKNNTSGSFTLTFKPSGQSGISLAQGQWHALIYDGTNIVEVSRSFGLTTPYTTNAIIYASSTTALAMSSNLTWNGSTLLAQAAGAVTIRANNSASTADAIVRAQNTSYQADLGADANGAYLLTGNNPFLIYVNGEKWRFLSTGAFQSNGAQTIQSSSGILTVVGTGGLTLSTAANTNAILNFGTGTTTITTSAASLSYLTQKSVLLAAAGGAVSQDNASFQYLVASGENGPSLGVGAAANNQIAAYVVRSGAKTSAQEGIHVENVATSAAASINRIGLLAETGGSWSGTSANNIAIEIRANTTSTPTNYGIYISACTGGTTNWALYNNTSANVYLGTGNVGQGSTAPGLLGVTREFTLEAKTATNQVALNLSAYATTNGAFGGFLQYYNNGNRVAYIASARVNSVDNSADLQFATANAGTLGTVLTLQFNGKIGLMTISPSFDLSFGGNTARTLALERHTTAATAGNALTIQAGGCVVGGTNLNGGDLLLYPGIPTGTGTSKTSIYAFPAGASGTTDGTAVLVAQFDGNATAGNTRLLIYDVDNATLERVSVGAADSGGTGFKLLRIPN